MSNELTWFLITLFSLSAVYFAGCMGREWLIGVSVILGLISSITAANIITLWGMSSSVATPIYAGIFLASDALTEFHGKREAKRVVWIGLFATIMLICLGQLVIHTGPGMNPEYGAALRQIFGFIPRLVIAGTFAYIVAQQIDIHLFHNLKVRTEGRMLWLRNNAATITAQLVDSVLVYYIAFWGIIPDIWQLVLISWITKIGVALLSTPFLYGIRWTLNYRARP